MFGLCEIFETNFVIKRTLSGPVPDPLRAFLPYRFYLLHLAFLHVSPLNVAEISLIVFVSSFI